MFLWVGKLYIEKCTHSVCTEAKRVRAKRQLQPSCRGNAVVLTAGVVTMEPCVLLQNVYEVMDGKYDSAWALLGQGQIPTGTGDMALARLVSFCIRFTLWREWAWPVHAVVVTQALLALCDPSVQVVGLLCGLNMFPCRSSVEAPCCWGRKVSFQTLEMDSWHGLALLCTLLLCPSSFQPPGSEAGMQQLPRL